LLFDASLNALIASFITYSLLISKIFASSFPQFSQKFFARRHRIGPQGASCSPDAPRSPMRRDVLVEHRAP